jgi:hypothetical protein
MPGFSIAGAAADVTVTPEAALRDSQPGTVPLHPRGSCLRRSVTAPGPVRIREDLLAVSGG